MDKRLFLHSLISGLLAALAAFIYDRIYFFATEVDFSKVLNLPTMIGVNLTASLLAGLVYAVLRKRWNGKGEIVFNFLFSICSFALVIVPISMTLPLSIDSPELFPGLAVPMVFFPALSWFTIQPLFVPGKG